MADEKNGCGAACAGVVGIAIALCVIINVVTWLKDVALPWMGEAAQTAATAIGKAAEDGFIPAIIGIVLGGFAGACAAALHGLVAGKATEKANQFGPLPWQTYASSINDLWRNNR